MIFSRRNKNKIMSTGKRLEQVAERFNEGAQTGVVTRGRPAVDGGPETQFPRKFDAGTAEWDRMTAVKQSLVVDPATGMTPFGRLQFSDRDAQALLRKEDVLREAEFDSWFNQNFNKADLATRRLAQEIYPEFFAKREAEMINRAKLALQIALIQLRGPKTEEDLMIQFGIENGDVTLEEGWNVIGYNRGFEAADFDALQNSLQVLGAPAGTTSRTRNWLAPEYAPFPSSDRPAARVQPFRKPTDPNPNVRSVTGRANNESWLSTLRRFQ